MKAFAAQSTSGKETARFRACHARDNGLMDFVSVPNISAVRMGGSGWGVVQLVGHLTVNEDGVGSSPTAPANCPNRTATVFLGLVANCRKARFSPAAPTAVHRNHVAIAHS